MELNYSSQEPVVIWGMLFLILTGFEKDRLELTFLSPDVNFLKILV